MKKYISLSLITGVAMILGACKKEGPNIFNMFTDVKVEFHNNDPQDIVDYKVVHVGDDVWIDYTVTSAKQDMYGLSLLEVGTSSPTKYVLDSSQRRSASGIIKLTATARTGQISYRLYATDKIGVYMGDGYKKITMDVVNDFNFTTERFVYLPNSVALVDTPSVTVSYPLVDPKAQSFYSIDEAKAYSYEEGAANSAKIDAGIYYKAVLTKNSNGTLKAKEDHYYMYAPGATPSPLPFNDFNFTGWTAKGTLFSTTVVSSSTFTKFQTGQQIADAAKKVAVNQTNIEIKSGNAYYFLTKDGKYGAIYISNLGSDRKHTTPYMDFLVKVQI